VKSSAPALRPSKGLGQHFLRDEGYINAILEALPAQPVNLVEVGPGTGVMTEGLLAQGRNLAAVELDGRLVADLRRRFEPSGRFSLVAGDALEVDLGGLLPQPYAIFGNIPYYITGALVPRMLASTPGAEWVSVLVQEEVAERLCAPPGGWSLATLGVRAFADADLVLRVPAYAFDPAPKVDSALVVLRPHAPVPFAGARFFDFARLVFMERRKMLPNAVSNAMDHDAGAAREVVERADLDPARRPQTLDLDEWGRLYGAYVEARG
jgi:16S rRNA (adenine1518-N6/adenine1519-N6)-dimethyltransferase